MELTPEEIFDKIQNELDPRLGATESAKFIELIREYGKQLLKAEQERLEKQVKGLTTDELHEPAEAFRIAGKIEGLKMSIENIRQTLKSK